MSTSTDQNPNFVYDATGTYTVTLTVSLPSGKEGIIVKDIDVFQLSDTSYTEDITNLYVEFSNTSIVPNPISWHWTFGDGFTSNDENPAHTYLNAGFYPTSLTIHTLNGGIGFAAHNITVFDEAVAAFSSDGGDPDIIFTDESIMDNPDTWAWDFGDSLGTSSLQNPTYSYTANGTYTVRLTITTIGGSTDFIEHDVVISSFISTWSHFFDFTASDGGFTGAAPASGIPNAIYVPATGWQDNPANGFTQIHIFKNFTSTPVTQIDFTFQKTTTIGAWSTATGSTYTSPGTVNSTSGVTTTNVHQAISESPPNNTSLQTYSEMFDSTSVASVQVNIILFGGGNNATLKSLTVYGTGTDPF